MDLPERVDAPAAGPAKPKRSELKRVSEESPQPSFLRRAFRVFVRLTLAILLGVALGVGAFFGARRLIEATRQNSARIAELEAGLQESSGALAELREVVDQGLAGAESGLSEQSDSLGELQVQIEDLQAELADQGGRQERFTAELNTLGDQLDDLVKQMEEGGEQKQLQRDLKLTQAMLFLVRARLWLVENNLGLATSEVERARVLLLEVVAEQEAENVRAAIERLDFALVELRTTPLVAADDIEIAWKLLVGADEG